MITSTWLKAAAARFRCRPMRGHIMAAARLQLVYHVHVNSDDRRQTSDNTPDAHYRLVPPALGGINDDPTADPAKFLKLPISCSGAYSWIRIRIDIKSNRFLLVTYIPSSDLSRPPGGYNPPVFMRHPQPSEGWKG